MPCRDYIDDDDDDDDIDSHSYVDLLEVQRFSMSDAGEQVLCISLLRGAGAV